MIFWDEVMEREASSRVLSGEGPGLLDIHLGISEWRIYDWMLEG